MNKSELVLRDFNQNDIDLLVTYLNKKSVTRYLGSRIPQPYSTDDARRWVDIGSKESINRAIQIDGILVGSIGVSPGKFDKRKSAEIGYWLEENSWGKGIATEAVMTIMDYVFTSSDIVRLFAPVYDQNKASMRVLEKCGFTLEGVLKKAVFKHGVFFDEHMYAITRV